MTFDNEGKRIRHRSWLLPFVMVACSCLFLHGATAARAAWILEPLVEGGIGDDGVSGDSLNSTASLLALVPSSSPVSGRETQLWVGGARATVTRVLTGLGVATSTITSRFDGELPAPDPLDARPRIHRRSAVTEGPWELVYLAPTVDGDARRPRFADFLDSIVWQSPTDPEPVLYVATRAVETSMPCEVLRFTSSHGLFDEATVVFRSCDDGGARHAMRSMERFGSCLCVGLEDGSLWASTAPEGEEVDGFPDRSFQEGWTCVARADDLVAASQSVGTTALPTEDTPVPEFHHDLLAVGSDLCSALSRRNGATAGGFWIFRGHPSDEGLPLGPWTWEELARDGLGNVWHETCDLALHEGALYVSASADFRGSADEARLRALGSHLSEGRGGLYRRSLSGSWEMVLGNGAGNTMFAGRTGSHDLGFWLPETLAATLAGGNFSLLLGPPRLWSFDGRLFASASDLRVFLAYLPANQDLLSFLDPSQVEQVMSALGALDSVNPNPPGADLYVSADGRQFEARSRNGFGKGHNLDFRPLMDDGSGVLLGASNPFEGFSVLRLREEFDPPAPAPDAGGGGGGCSPTGPSPAPSVLLFPDLPALLLLVFPLLFLLLRRPKRIGKL